MLKPGPQPKKICQLCGKRVAVRKNGAFREHARRGPMYPRSSQLCPGSGSGRGDRR